MRRLWVSAEHMFPDGYDKDCPVRSTEGRSLVVPLADVQAWLRDFVDYYKEHDMWANAECVEDLLADLAREEQ